jgi:lysophospholipase L1-like esterase
VRGRIFRLVLFLLWVGLAISPVGSVSLAQEEATATPTVSPSPSPSPTPEATTVPEVKSPVKILWLGDSIMNGWGLASPWCSRNWAQWKLEQDGFSVVSVGRPGYNSPDGLGHYHEGHVGWHTYDGLADLPGLIQEFTPNVLFVRLGVNDQTWSGPLDNGKAVANIVEIVRLSKQLRPTMKVIISTLPEVNPAHINSVYVDDYNNRLTYSITPLTTVHHPGTGPNAGWIDQVHPDLWWHYYAGMSDAEIIEQVLRSH